VIHDWCICGLPSTESAEPETSSAPTNLNSAADWSVMLTHLPHRNGIE
jgi:hypothetical protein